MTRVIIVIAALLAYTSGAFAACPGARLTSTTTPTLQSAISGRQINANSPGGENWKEIHCTDGRLQKVGVSPTDPVDPQVTVGTWSTNTNGSVAIYNYGTPATTYRWRVYRVAATDILCWQENAANGATIATAVAPSTAGTCVP